MTRRVPEDPSKSGNSRTSATEQKLKDLLPPALANSPAIGFAVCDRRLRFRIVNNAWARMGGVSRDAHLGATVRSILGPAAKQFQLAFERVFSSGNPLLGYEFSAEFPGRTGEAHWIASCFPVGFASSPGEFGAELVAQQGISGRKHTFESQLKLFRCRSQDGTYGGAQVSIATHAAHPRPGIIDYSEAQTAVAHRETNCR